MGASLATVRKHLDAVSAAVLTLGPTATPEPAPTYLDAKARFGPYTGHLGADDTTGFDEPIRMKAPGYAITRKMGRETGRILIDRANPAMVINIQIDGGNGTHGDTMWFDEPYYADWLKYGLESWAGERAIDCRHLTNEEYELLATIVDAYAMKKMPGTWLSWHYRVTLDQMEFSMQRRKQGNEEYDGSWDPGHKFPFYLDIPTNYGIPNPRGVVNFKGKLSDAARQYVDPKLLAAAPRILTMFDSLKLRVP